MWLLATALDSADLDSHSSQSLLTSSSALCTHPLCHFLSHTCLLPPQSFCTCSLLFLEYFSLPYPQLPHLFSYCISFTTSNYVVHLFVHSIMVEVLSLSHHHSTHPLVKIYKLHLSKDPTPLPITVFPPPKHHCAWLSVDTLPISTE